LSIVVAWLLVSCRAVEGPVLEERDAGASGETGWVTVFRSSSDEIISALGSDASGHSYLALDAALELAVEPSNGSSEIVSVAGDEATWIVRLDPAGLLSWSNGYAVTGINVDARGLAVRADGTTLFSGLMSGQSMFGATSCNSLGGQDAVALLHDPAGALVWTQCFGSDRNFQAHTGGFDGDTVLTAGFYWSTRPFTFGPISFPMCTDDDIFVMRHDAATGAPESGHPVAVSLEGLVRSLAVGAGGYATTGPFRGMLGVRSAPVAVGLSDAFFTSFDDAGVEIATVAVGSAADDLGRHVVFTGDGYAWLVNLGGPATLDGPVGTAGGSDFLVAHVAMTGEISWVRSFGGPSADRGAALAYDAATRSLLVGGTFSGSWTSDPMLDATEGDDGFVMKLDAETGAVRASRRIGGSGDDSIHGLAIASDGLRIAGTFTGELAIAGTTIVATGTDAFVASIPAL
jgi:hypothetical protein